MLPQLDITYYTSQLFWLFVCLGILVFLFKKTFIPRMNNLINKRDSIIEEGKASISILELEISSLKDEINSIKNQELKQTSKIIKDSVIKSEKILEEQLKFIKNENTELLHAEKLKFNSEINSLETSLKSQVENSSKVFLDKLFLRRKNV